MLSIKNSKKRNFFIFLVSIFLFSQSEINKVHSELNNETDLVNIKYLENTVDNFYILGEGDLLAIEILNNFGFGSNQESQIEVFKGSDYYINTQGNINMPEIGRIFVSGLTIKELEDLLNKKYKSIIKFPDIKVSLKKQKPIKISIRGEVKNPGMYIFFNESTSNIDKNTSSLGFTPTLFNAIQKAGGITPFSDLTKIKVTRENPISKGGGQIQTTLNLLNVLSTGDKSQNIKLNNNDTIFVEKGDEKITFMIKEALKTNINSPFINVYISGDIQKPGPLNLKRDTDLNTAILISGGQGFFKGNVTLSRFTSDGGYSNKNFRFNRNNKRGSKKNPYLKDGDIIYVGKHSLKVVNEIVTDLTRPFVGIYSTYKIFDF